MYPSSNNSKDLFLLENIQSNGIEYLYNMFNKLSKISNKDTMEDIAYIKLYSLIHLSSNIIDVDSSYKDNNEIDFFKKLLLNKDPFISFLLTGRTDELSIFINNFNKNIVSILFSINLNNKFFYYQHLLTISTFKEYVYNNFWNFDTGYKNEQSILGNIINAHDIYNDNDYQIELDKVLHLLNYFDNVYSNKTTCWINELILQNIKYREINTMVTNNNKNLSSLMFLTKAFNIIIEIYKQHTNTEYNFDYIKIHLKNWYNKQYIKVDNITEQNSTNLFITVIQMLSITICPVIDIIISKNKELEHIQDIIQIEKTSIRWNNFSIITKDVTMNNLYKRETTVKTLIESNLKILNSDILINNYLYILDHIVSIVIDNPQKYDDIFSLIVDDISYILCFEEFFKKYKLDVHIYKNKYINLIRFSMLVLKNDPIKLLPHIKSRFLQFLHKINHIILDLSENNTDIDIIDYIKCLVHYYIDIESNKDDSFISTKMNIKYNILNILDRFFNYKNNLLHFEFSQNIDFNKLVYILIIDNNIYFEEIIYNIELIISYNTDLLTKKDIINTENLIWKTSNKLSTIINFYEMGINMLLTIISYFPKNIINDLNCTKFIESLNFYIYKVLSDKFNNIYTFDFSIYNINFTWKNLLVILSKVYNKIPLNNNIINCIINDDRSYAKELFIKLNDITSDNLLTIIDKLDQHIETTEIYNKDIPDEFCDPLLMLPIKEPLILPESKIFIDKNCILSHLMLDETDPFNRTKLTLEDLYRYNNMEENKQKIQAFKLKFLNWKNKHRIKKS